MGSVIGANFALIYVSGGIGALREKFTAPWILIAVRIVAAWIGALSIMMAALTAAHAPRC